MKAPSASPATGPLGQRAYEIADHLASSIGPRPAGSAGEEAALAYAESVLLAAGTETHRHAVHGIPTASGAARWMDIAFLLGVIAVARLLVPMPWLALLYLPVFFLLPSRLRAVLRRGSFSPGILSHSLIADHPPRGEARGLLIIGAHIDTAGGRRLPWLALNHLQRWYTHLLRALVIVLAAAGVAKLLTDWLLPLPPGLWAVVGWCGSCVSLLLALYEAAYFALSPDSAPSPGANDNGSSVGVALAAAEHFAVPERRPEHLALRYGLWTAEEKGLYGSKRYAQETRLHPTSTWVLNMDMVGTGRALSLVRGVGIVPFRRTDAGLNGLLRRAMPGLEAVNYFMRSSDFKPFLDVRIRAASLTATGGRRNWYCHTPEDSSEHLQAELLEQAAQATIAVAALLDEQLRDAAPVGLAAEERRGASEERRQEGSSGARRAAR